MGNMKLLLKIVALLFSLVLISNAHAALIDRGDGLIYDTGQNITWLQDANYSALLTDAQVTRIVDEANAANWTWLGSHTLGVADFLKSDGAYNGRMTWWGAMAWAEVLEGVPNFV
jgi:hypothetical protein